MSDDHFDLVLAMPLHTADRDAVRVALGGHPLPSIYPDSTAYPCTLCEMTLAVGPRSAELIEAKRAKPFCPICIAKLVRVTGYMPPSKNLGNQNSGFEK